MTAELGQFLRSRRARRRPETAGVPTDLRRRRVPGLRREELAALAGVSTGYYARLEQGAGAGASPAVLDAIARALDLDDTETTHLHLLAAPPRPVRRRATRSHLRPGVRGLLDAVPTTAALVIDRRCDVLGWNRLGHALLAGHLDPDAPDHPVRPNVARLLFLDPHTRALYPDRAEKARLTVAALHRAAAHRPDDPGLARIVGELTTASPEFATMWSRRPVRSCGHAERRLHHPLVGPLTLTNETVELPDDDGQQLGLFYARPGTAAAAALELLARLTTEPTATRRPGRTGCEP